MKIFDHLRPSDVVGDLAGTTGSEILAELCRPVAEADSLDARVLLATLLARERLSSTGIGDGVAIPHGRIAGLAEPRVTIARSRSGIDFNAADAKPAHIFIALFTPESQPGVHLQALSRISRIFRTPAFRESLMTARDAAEMYQLLREEDART